MVDYLFAFNHSKQEYIEGSKNRQVFHVGHEFGAMLTIVLTNAAGLKRAGIDPALSWAGGTIEVAGDESAAHVWDRCLETYTNVTERVEVHVRGREAELWCVHVEGPDSLIVQPDRETAERRAKKWNEGIAKSGVLNHENSPHIHCKAIPWTGSAETHAASLAEHGGQPDDIC